MKTIKIFLPLALVFSLVFIGCGKYEEGPAVSLKTKKARLSRSWVIEKYIESDGTSSVPTSTDNFTVTFTKDGVVTYSAGGFSFAGTWAFTSDKTGLTTTFAGFGYTETSTETILKLTSKELWLKDSDGDKTYFKAQ